MEEDEEKVEGVLEEEEKELKKDMMRTTKKN